MMPKNRDRRLLLLGCAAAVVVIPLFLYQEPAVYRQRRQTIRAMSQAEQTRLKHNLDTFLEMSESDRDTYRRLHQVIEEDTREGGSLRDVMHNYYAWLKTLDPWDREKLRRTEDPVDRFRLVKELKEERESKDESRHRKSYVDRLFDSDVRLDAEDLAAVVNVVGQQLDLPEKDQNELQDLTGLQRSLRVLEAALEREEEERNPDGTVVWPDQQLAKQLLAAVTDEKVLNAVRAETEPENRRAFLAALIADALQAQWWTEMRRLLPSEEESRRFFVALGPERQDEIMRAPPKWQKIKIHRLFLEKNRPAFSKSGYLVRRIAHQLTPDIDRDRGPRHRSGKDRGSNSRRRKGRR